MTVTTNTAPLTAIQPSSLNPRKYFDPEKLEELAESIRQFGLIEPIVVREIDFSGYDGSYPFPDNAPPFEIIAGERRFRAAQLAGLTEVPIRNLGSVDDHDALKLALIENLQRVDLDPIEEAEGYRQLNKIVGLKQSEIANAVNRSQPAVANAMRLLDLPDDVQDKIRTRQLSVSHGIALCRFNGFPAIQSAMAAYAITNAWTAKALEKDAPWYVLLNQRLIVNLGFQWDAGFPECQHCPFDARRNPNGAHYCLKPEHYHELDMQRVEQRQAERAAQLGKTPPPNDLPQLRSLQSDQWTYIHDGLSSCTDACPCRQQAIDYGGNVITICGDPTRYRTLKTADTKAQTKKRREDGERMLAQVVNSIDRGGDPASSQNLAILAAAALIPISKPSAITESAKRHLPELADQNMWSSWAIRGETFPRIAEWANADPDRVLRFALEALLRDQIKRIVEDNDSGGHAWLDEYLTRNSTLMAAISDDEAAE